MKVTFIIIAYNAQKHIKESLECISNQDYNHDDIEIILVDSNSKDNTKNIFEEFASTSDFKNIKILDNVNKTLPHGWNIALKEATGEVVLRVDAHTIFENNFVTKNVEAINSGEDIVGGKCVSIIKDTNRFKKLLLEADNSLFGCGIAGFRRLETKKYVSTLAFAMYKKNIFDKVGLYNTKLARTEDNEMHYRMKNAGYKFAFIPDIVIKRYTRSTFKDLVRQKFLNGKWIGITLKYCSKCFSLYHFIPLVFVSAILFSTIFTMFNINIFIYLLVGAYSIFNIVNIILVSIKNGFKLEYILLPFIYFSLHISYGVGTMYGIINSIFIKRKVRG